MPPPSRPLKALSKLLDKVTRGRRALALLIAFIAASGASALTYVNYAPEANKLCLACHNMEPFYRGLLAGGHEEVNCHKCHPLTPSVVKELWIQLTESPSAAEIKERMGPRISMYEACLTCHSIEDLSSLQIHEAHLEMALEVIGSCDICHNPHSPGDLDLNCRKCHGEARMVEEHWLFHEEAIARLEKGDTNVCLECHSSTATWEIELAPSCIRGQIEGKSCFDCHSAPLRAPDISLRQCIECHG